jgi:O-antigen/teichoic acid export membrane protein
VVAICYCAVAWVARDWLFTYVLKKQLPQRDELLLLWFAIALAMLLRDQLIYLLAVRERLRSTSTLTFFSALVSIAASYFGILYFGVIGALAGVLVGEILNVTGLIFLSVMEVRRPLKAAES